MKQDVQDAPGLLLNGNLPAGKVVREHRSVEQIADYVQQLIDRDVANLPFGNVRSIERSQSLAVRFAMLDVGWLLAVLEESPFVNQQFAQLRMDGEECQIGSYHLGDPLGRIFDRGHASVDILAELPHAPIGGRQKELALAGKIAIEGAFPNAQLIGQLLGVGIGVAMLGKQLGGGIEDSSRCSALRSILASVTPEAGFKGAAPGAD